MLVSLATDYQAVNGASLAVVQAKAQISQANVTLGAALLALQNLQIALTAQAAGVNADVAAGVATGNAQTIAFANTVGGALTVTQSDVATTIAAAQAAQTALAPALPTS
jgi:hypothetical protein